ncbi:uncharacterized protein LOC124702901 isoform X2 [Lolium rigidum]|uniref:uncharacterized protein LOC124702901 isoform X2 n=1 Tax=Lolium rigidum TaxID=89674 RepID=UPI001F5D1B1F|nr:uncharacterized protein LOC124702901 isoform X2 [Lolium rigidum]
MTVQLAEGHIVHFTSEQCRLLRIVTNNPQDYCSWRALVDTVADEVSDADGKGKRQMKLYVVFYLLRMEFPCNYTDFDEFAKLNSEFVVGDDMLEKYHNDAVDTLHSLERWERFCDLALLREHESTSGFFEEAIRHVGSYYQSDNLWRSYIEYETRNENLITVGQLYTSLLSCPVRGIETFFAQFKIFVEKHSLMEILSSSEFSKFNEKSEYIESREALFRSSEQQLLETKIFEDLIVPDSEAETLDEQITSNWFSYLNFLKEKGNRPKVIALYNRASCQLHSYPDFWISYVEYLMSLGEKKMATEQLDFAIKYPLKRNVSLQLYSAKFGIANNDLDRARNAYVLTHSILSPNHPGAIEGHALIELRRKCDGSQIFKNAIESEKKKGNTELLPNLLIRYGYFALSAGIRVSFDEVIGELSVLDNLSSATILSAISLCSFNGFKAADQISKLDGMVDTFIHNRPLTNQEKKKALSSSYLEFLHTNGHTSFLEKATSRHELIVSQNGGSEKDSLKIRKMCHQDAGLIDDDLTVLDLNQFLNTFVLVKDSDYSTQLGQFKITKVLPIGTRLLAAIVKAKLKRHRRLRSWGGQLDAKDIFIMYDGSELSAILCSIRKDCSSDLSHANFLLDWIAVKKCLTPAFTSKQTGFLPRYFVDFFERLIERVPANLLSHIESRELYFFQISCSMFLSTPGARSKFVCDLYKCFRDVFYKSEAQFNSIFDTAKMSNLGPASVSHHPVLQRVVNHGQRVDFEPRNIEVSTPSKLVSENRHLDAHGSEAAKSIGKPIKRLEELVDIFDQSSGTDFCGIVWDLCRNIHRDEMLEEACVAFSSNVVEPPRSNPFLPHLQPKPRPGITESGCLVTAELCHQRNKNVSCVLWFGNVDFSGNEVNIFHELSSFGKVKTLRLRRNVLTGLPEGDGFVEFNSHKEAQNVLRNWNQRKDTKPWVMEWATFSCSRGCFESKQGKCILVHNLRTEVNDYILQEKFRQYPSFAGAVVARDLKTGLSQGYGFVKFSNEADHISALGAENNKECLGMPMIVVDHKPRVGFVSTCAIVDKRPDLNHWVGSYQHAHVQSYGCDGGHDNFLKKIDGLDSHVHVMEGSYEQTSVEKMNQAYVTGPGRAVLGWEMKLKS